MDRLGIIDALDREQRDALALWRSLRPEEWRAASLCKGWTVKDVAEHVVAAERNEFPASLRRALAGDASAPPGFVLERANAEHVARLRSRPVSDLLADAEGAIADTRRTLEGLSDEDFGRAAWNPITPIDIAFYARGRIWEWWTHNQDVRVPLRRPGGREPDRTRPVVEVVRDGIPGVFLPERARGVHTSYAFRVGDVGFTIRIDEGRIAVEDAFDARAKTRVVADPATFILVGTRRIPQWRAVLSGKFRPSGNPLNGLKFLSYFRPA